MTPAGRRRARVAARGFTLIELAVVIAIVGFLLGAILVPLSTQFEIQRTRSTERDLADVKTALIGYALVNGRLPCPDTSATPDGVEDSPCPVDASGAHPEGYLPWITLGITPEDAWGHLYEYAVTAEHTYVTVPGSGAGIANQLDLKDGGGFTIVTRDDSKNSVTLTSSASAVVVSLGSNGSGGRDIDGNTVAAPTGADELNNTIDSTANTFVSRRFSEGATPCDDTTTNPNQPLCAYDDLVVWIPTTLLMGKLVAAGQLP